MDITVTESRYEAPGAPFLLVTRTVVEDDGSLQTIIERAPSTTLAIRAAEYDLEPDDDFVLDLVMLEPFMRPVEGPGQLHPLYAADSVKDALEIMRERVELARAEHGAPKGRNRMMAAAVRNGVASAGLVSVHRQYSESADPRLVQPIRRMRDESRERLSGAGGLGDSVPFDLARALPLNN